MLFSLRAESQDAETIADVRCVVVGIKIGGAINSPQQSAGAMLALYYIGRLEGRVPKPDIEGLILSESSSMTTAEYTSEAKRCAAGLAGKAQQIAEIGKIMIEREQKTLGKAAPAK